MKFITDICDKESVITILVSYLRDFGIKVPKLKKSPDKWDDKSTTNVFGNCLHQIATVETEDGLQIPKFLDEAVGLIRENISTEGLFRRAGSISRQKHLKECIERGGSILGCHVLDVANLVKQFFRELPEPLIPPKMNDAFVKAYQLQSEYCKEHAVLMLCALLPAENLHTLRYFMMFLADIASGCTDNKMDSSNLSLIITPNVMPITEKSEKWEKLAGKLLQQHMGVIKLLIEIAPRIGMVPDSILERLAIPMQNPSDDDFDSCSRDRPRKSARKSLTGVIKGLKTMVQSRPVLSSDNDDRTRRSSPTIHSSKRKSDEEPEDASVPKRSSPDFYKQAIMPGAATLHNNASTFLNLPTTSVNHFDSPNPSGGFNESAVSLTPAINRQHSGRRKSKRGNILSRAYLKRRSHTFVTPKTNNKVENRKKSEFFLSPMSCIRSDSTTARRLSRSKSERSPVEDLICISRDALKDSYTNKGSMPRKMKSAIDIVGLSEVAIAIGVGDYPLENDKPVCVVEMAAEVKFDPAKPKLPRRRSNTEGSIPVESLPMRKLGSARKLYKVPLSSSTSSSNLFDSPPNPAKPTCSKFESRSSLRRGRPNSVRTGLVLPKILKLGGDDYEDADATPVDLQSFLPEQFVEELTSASRRSVFGSPTGDKVSIENMDMVSFNRKSPSIDSGVGKSLLDMATGDNWLSKRKSLSLTSLMEQVVHYGNVDQWQDADEVFEEESAIKPEVVFATPSAVRQRPKSKFPEPVSTGRPSLAIMMNEKKGTVSANVQRFNALSNEVASGGPLTPIRVPNTNANKCQSLDVPKTPKLRLCGSVERELNSKRRVLKMRDEKEQKSPSRRKLNSTPKSEGKKRKVACTVASNISPAKPVRM